MLPESVIVETTEYKCLQSQFSVLYNESMQIKTQLDENRTMLTNSKNTHLRQIEQMEVGVSVSAQNYLLFIYYLYIENAHATNVHA